VIHTTEYESYEGLLVEYEVASSLFTHPTDAGLFTTALRNALKAELPGASVRILHDYEMSRIEWTKILEPGLYPEGPGRSMGGSALEGSDYQYDLEQIDTTVGVTAKEVGAGFTWLSGARTATLMRRRTEKMTPKNRTLKKDLRGFGKSFKAHIQSFFKEMLVVWTEEKPRNGGMFRCSWDVYQARTLRFGVRCEVHYKGAYHSIGGILDDDDAYELVWTWWQKPHIKEKVRMTDYKVKASYEKLYDSGGFWGTVPRQINKALKMAEGVALTMAFARTAEGIDAAGGSLEKSYGGYSSFRPMRHSEQEAEQEVESDDELAELLELAWNGR
jgi:hypothetical protein